MRVWSARVLGARRLWAAMVATIINDPAVVAPSAWSGDPQGAS
jgi:hypothetical protein